MRVEIFLGNSIVTAIFFWISIIIVAGFFATTLFAIFYHRFIYPKILRPSYNHSYRPRCSIILPCKGVPRNFESNIQSFLKLDYKDYEVIYTVEREDDPAIPIIKRVAGEDPRASIVVAGLTSTCSQKNHNIIAALDKADNPDVYVFADSDIEIHDNWLKELILPLSQPNITVTTGFRWLYSSTGKMGGLANAYQNSMLFVLFSFASYIQDVGLWGGSMAMKKEDFDKLGVLEYWAKTVVDDMSLSRIVMKKSKKTIMVSTCIIPTDDTLETLGESIRWFERQVMFLKAYQKRLWYFAVMLVTACLILQISLPVNIFISYFTEESFFDIGGASSLIFNCGIMAIVSLYPFLGKHPKIVRFIFLQPISLFTILYSVLKTLFTNTIKWSGFNYKLNFSGNVVSIK